MRAVAGKGSLRRKQTISERLVKAQEFVKEMDEQEKQQQGEGEDKRRQAALERVARERLERMEAAMKELDVRQKEERKKDPEQVRVSLSEPEARKMKHPDGGWAPIHAVDLLVALGAHAAIEPMLELLTPVEFDEILPSRIVVRLPQLGAAVLEPALAHIDRTTDPDVLHALACVVSALGVRDDQLANSLFRQIAHLGHPRHLE